MAISDNIVAKALQVLEILSSCDPAPGTQIHTGQPGTTQHPTSMEVDDMMTPVEVNSTVISVDKCTNSL